MSPTSPESLLRTSLHAGNLLKSFIYFILCIRVRICIFVWVYPDTHGGQKRVSDVLDLDLQTIISLLMWVPGIK